MRFLTLAEVANEFAVEILVLLVFELSLAGILAIALSFVRFVGNARSADLEGQCGGFLALIVINLSVYYLMQCFNGYIHYPVSMAGVALIMAIVVVLETIVLLALARGMALSTLDELNANSALLLIVSALLLLPIVLHIPRWRGFDPLPQKSAAIVATQSKRPNILLITLDALTAEDMSVYGYVRNTTPGLEHLAEHCYRFTNFISSCDFTTPAVASLLTGEYPLTHRVFQLDGQVPPKSREHNLAWVLRENGYTTGAIVTNLAANPLTLRLDDSFKYLLRPPMNPWMTFGTSAMQLDPLLSAAIYKVTDGILGLTGWAFNSFNHEPYVNSYNAAKLSRDFISSTPEPYFLWLHLLPPHAPYVNSSGFRFPGLSDHPQDFETQEQYYWRWPTENGYYSPSQQPTIDLLRMRYDESIADTDRALAHLLEWLDRTGRRSNTIVIVTADHGENFCQGYYSHASPDLHYAEVHIPLLISLPGQSVAETSDKPGDLTDVAPTILSLLKIDVPPWMEGKPLLSADWQTEEPRPAFSMYLARSSIFGPVAKGSIAADDGRYRMIWNFENCTVRLYDIQADPEEKVDVASEHPARVTELLSLSRDRFGRFLRLKKDDPTASLKR